MVLADDGRHVWVARARDPTEPDIARAEAGLVALGHAGWLAVSEGDYWGTGFPMTLLMVRPLANPCEGGWETAVAAFTRQRMDALHGLP